MTGTSTALGRFGAVQPIAPSDLVAHITTHLRQRIVSGELPPDSELPPEGHLAALFNVSRTVVREAMRHLRSQGLVEVGRGRKPRVKPVEPEAAIEALNAMLQRSEGSRGHLLEIRRSLELEIAALAAERASTAQIEAIERANDALRDASDTHQRIACDWQFHERLAEATNNPMFVLLVKTVAGLFRELMQRTSHSDTQVVYAAHGRLIEAIRARDVDAARRIARDNLELTRRDLEDVTATETETPS